MRQLFFLQNVTNIYNKIRQVFYYKMQQTFITKYITSFIRKCDSHYEMGPFYYKIRQLLQSTMFVTKYVGAAITILRHFENLMVERVVIISNNISLSNSRNNFSSSSILGSLVI